MAMETLEKLSTMLRQPVEELLKRLEEAGIQGKTAKDSVTPKEKAQLISMTIKSAPGGFARRKTVMTKIKLGNKAGAGTVMVETIKSRHHPKPKPVLKTPEPKPEEKDAAAKTEDKTAATAEKKEDAEKKTKTAKESETKKTNKAAKLKKMPAPETKTTKKEKAVAKNEAAAVNKEPATTTKANKKSQARKEGSGTAKGRLRLNMAPGKPRKRRPKIKRAGSRVYSAKIHQFEMPTSPVKREVQVPATIEVTRLAEKLAMKASELTKQMMEMGVMATVNQALDQDTAVLIVEELGHTAKPISEIDAEEKLLLALGVNDADKSPRPPIVTFMGHVDHGKTALLDKLRKSSVASNEFGGITQHIGAYQLSCDCGGAKRSITFLDTPGHEAFSAMRARGAQVTDIVVLVVAAGEGVKPQTLEAITHAKKADVPIVVAVSKIDKEGADAGEIKSELAKHEIVAEDWGGKNIFVNTSAKTGEGLNDLIEALLLQAEVMELQAHDTGNASGVVIESSVEKGRGAAATVIVQDGCLKPTDIVLCGGFFGKARMLNDEHGRPLKYAKPATPVVIIGLSGVPETGDKMNVVGSEKIAREVAEFRQKRERVRNLSQTTRAISEDMFSAIKSQKKKSLILLIKADVKGSSEALKVALNGLQNDEIETKIIASGIGDITESDVNLATTAKAVIIGFNVRTDAQARALAKKAGVSVRHYNIIYEVLDDVKEILIGLLDPVYKERVLGRALVKDIFPSSEFGVVAGCQVSEGTIKRRNRMRIKRGDEVIHEGAISSLRRFKDNVEEVVSGTECGIGIKNHADIKSGDVIVVFERFELERKL